MGGRGFIERVPRGVYCTKEEVLCISILRLGRWNVYWELKRLIGLFVVNNVYRRRFEQGPLISLLSSSDAGGFLFLFFFLNSTTTTRFFFSLFFWGRK